MPSLQASSSAFVILLMGIFWVTEALPLPITGSFPVFLLPVLGIMPASEVSRNYIKVSVSIYQCTSLMGLSWRVLLRVCVLFRQATSLFPLI